MGGLFFSATMGGIGIARGHCFLLKKWSTRGRSSRLRTLAPIPGGFLVKSPVPHCQQGMHNRGTTAPRKLWLKMVDQVEEQERGCDA